MYRVIITSSGNETIIHEPTADQAAPHLLSMPFKESLNQADDLSFVIPIQNPGYDLIKGMKTKVRVIDTRDNTVVFSGRVVPTKDAIDTKVVMSVECEGAMNYLNDTHTRRWHLANKTPQEILQYLLDQHNSKVDDSRKIYLGIVEPSIRITVDTNLETTLNAVITKVRNILGGDLRVQERNNKLYLDYLTDQGENNNVILRFMYNVDKFIRTYDPTDLITRGIPMGYGEGINQLDITSVNGGVEYIEDTAAIEEYGVIEGVITNKDIQNALTLKTYGQTVLNEKKQPAVSYEISSKDLSVLAGHENEKYNLGDTIHSIIDILDVDVYARVIERERDLVVDPWNPKLTISTRPITLTDEMINLKQRNLTLENAPQGSTYIDTFGYAENIDENHSFKLPIWLSPDILNVNRVRLHIDSQKYRAYEKGLAGGGGTTTTTGPSSKNTSDSGGQSTQTSSSAGESTQTSSSGGGGTQTSNISSGLSNTLVKSWEDVLGTRQAPDNLGKEYVPVTENGSQPSVDLWWFHHTHDIDHKHTITIPSHQHDVTTPAHQHNVTIPSHSHGMDHNHEINIPDHTHEIEYGIFEDTYPSDVQIKINGATIPGVTLSEGENLEIDISQYVGTPGETYNLEVTSSRNGRVNVWVSIQAFIQIK